MKYEEVSDVLYLASGFDKRVLDPATHTAWFAIPEIRDMPMEFAQQFIVEYFVGPDQDKYLTVGKIVDAWRTDQRLNPVQIEEDVNAARAYGLVEKDWPKTQRIPHGAFTALQEYREQARTDALAIEEMYDGTWSALDSLGKVGKNVDE